MDSLTGTTVGPYGIGPLLGSGGMGEVYRAHDSRLDRDVALKVLSADDSTDAVSVGRFQKEAKAIAALTDPGIVTIYDCGFDDRVFYIAMELLEGETLRNVIASRPLPWRRALKLAIGIAGGLRSAHAKGIIHRDLKPENIFVTREGAPKILDFGLARSRERPSAAPDSLTMPGTIMGTAGYMAPEQVRGESASPASDVFSFGCVFYEMLSGRRAFEGASFPEAAAAVIRDEPAALRSIRPEIPESLARVVEHCLEKEQANRFHTAADLLFALLAVDQESTAPGGGTSRRIGLRAAAGSIVAIAILAGVILVGRRQAPSDTSPVARESVGTVDVRREAKVSRSSSEARKEYERGARLVEQRTPQNLRKAIGYFQRANEMDPSYADPYLGTAISYMLLGGTYEAMAPREAMPKAREAAKRALALNASLADAHATLANIHHEYDWDWPAAEREFKRALELDESSATAHQWYGQALVLRGRHGEGLRELALADKIDPRLFVVETDFAQAFWIAGDYDAALRHADRVIDAEERFWLAHWMRGLNLFEKDDLSGAEASMRRAIDLGGTPAVRGTLAAVYARGGRRAEAKAIIDELHAMNEGGTYVSRAGLIVAYAALGDLDRAYQEIDRALDEKASFATLLERTPIAEPIRRDPRYPALKRRIGLP